MPFLKDKSMFHPAWKQFEENAHKEGLRHAIFNVIGDKYIGEWHKDVKEGKGAIKTCKGIIYEGDLERGYRHGFGVLAHCKSNKLYVLEYRGDWKNGRKHGEGMRFFLDGSIYIGNWKNGKRSGYGRMWYACGDYYDGDWKNDMKHGEGMMIYFNGTRYEGFWGKDLKHGRGRYFHLLTGQMQEGVWHENVCVFSVMVDISFRQTVTAPTPYPIFPLKLENPNDIIERKEENVLKGVLNSCLNLDDVKSNCSEEIGSVNI